MNSGSGWHVYIYINHIKIYYKTKQLEFNQTIWKQASEILVFLVTYAITKLRVTWKKLCINTDTQT
jgi:hypothetical protein